MTTAEAIALANRVKPVPRVALDKSNASDALAKLGGMVAGLQKQIDWAKAGIELYADAKNINLGVTLQ